MSRALELARQGTALASPNPMVGAVVVRDGKIVGEGFHRYDEKKHAEVKALEQAGGEAHGATLYLNLEPCSHQGRTPPCADTVIAAGVKRVVAAMQDPNPRVCGQGLERLRAAGIEVTVGLLGEEARRLNESFTRYIRTGLPFVTLKAAMTLDGKIAAPDDNSGWVTSEEAHANVQLQRHEADAILTGVGTVIADDPLLTDRSGLPRRRPLLRVVMDSRLRMPLTSRIVSTASDDVLIYSHEGDSDKHTVLGRRGVEVNSGVPGDATAADARQFVRPDLRRVLRYLGMREITSVLLEAGAELNWAALEAGLVDKVFLYYAPKILGGIDSLPLAGGRGIRAMRDALAVSKIEVHRFGPDFAVEGYLRDVYGEKEARS